MSPGPKSNRRHSNNSKSTAERSTPTEPFLSTLPPRTPDQGRVAPSSSRFLTKQETAVGAQSQTIRSADPVLTLSEPDSASPTGTGPTTQSLAGGDHSGQRKVCAGSVDNDHRLRVLVSQTNHFPVEVLQVRNHDAFR